MKLLKKFELNCANIQGVYAQLLQRFTFASILFLAMGFVIYIFQLLPSYIEIDKIAELMKLRSTEYKSVANIPKGWGWLQLIGYSDYISFLAIAFMSAVSIFIYFILVHVFLRCRDYIFTSIAVVQILVFIFAASGIISAGH